MATTFTATANPRYAAVLTGDSAAMSIYGDFRLEGNASVKAGFKVLVCTGATVTIPAEFRLTLDIGAILTNKGTIINKGTINSKGIIVNRGTIYSNAPIGGITGNLIEFLPLRGSSSPKSLNFISSVGVEPMINQ